MSRDLINKAAAAGVLAFLVSIIAQFLLTEPKPEPGRARSLGPVDSAEREILRALERRSRGHDAWRRAAGDLLRSRDPLASFDRLELRLPERAEREMAASGFTGYYLGYALELRDERARAREAWERALEAFREWDPDLHAEERGWLGGADRLYEARTLMRLARDDEAASVLDRFDWRGAESELAVNIARTHAEIERQELAGMILDHALAQAPSDTVRRWLERRIRLLRDWRQLTREPEAARAMAFALSRNLEARLEGEPGTMPGSHFLVRWLADELRASGSPEAAERLWRLAEASALEEARRTGDVFSWRWVAKHRARLGDGPGVAEALRLAHATQEWRPDLGQLDAEDLVRDPDLERFFGLEEVREAVRLFGEPRAWASRTLD